VGNSKAVQQAIQDNGVITVEFFREKEKPKLGMTTGTLDYSTDYCNYRGTGNVGDFGVDMPYFDTTCIANSDSSVASSVCTDFLDSNDDMTQLGRKISSTKGLQKRTSKTKETGRIEKGGVSNQTFNYVDMEFEYYSFHTVEYKLLPESERKVEIGKIKLKCQNCGANLKPGWKVCPICTHPINEKGICDTCGNELESIWKVCPICGEPIM